jgi:hypothetical protein
MSGSTNLGLPQYVFNNIYEYGLTGALALATVQQRGADTGSAFVYYSEIVTALQSIGSSSVPAFGATPTIDYAYTLASVPPLACVGHISDWSYGRAQPAGTRRRGCDQRRSLRRCKHQPERGWCGDMTKKPKLHAHNTQTAGDRRTSQRWLAAMERKRLAREAKRKLDQQTAQRSVQPP